MMKGVVCVTEIGWHSRRASFVVILVRRFSGRKSFLLGPHHSRRDCPLAESKKRKEPRAYSCVLFPRGGRRAGEQATTHPADEHCATARGTDGERTQSDDVKIVFALVGDPGLAEPDDDPDGNDF